MLKIKSILLRGYKSFANTEMQEIAFGDITILIGANGAGKSNIISAFRLLNYAMTGGLQTFAMRTDPASFFFNGPRKTPIVDISFQLEDENGARDEYALTLGFGSPNKLLVMTESIKYQSPEQSTPYIASLIPDNFSELGLWKDHANDTTRKVVYAALSSIRAYQFHDTSDGANIKLPSPCRNKKLMSDGGNLAAFLKSIQDTEERYFERIKNHIRVVMPQFDDFDLSEDKYGNVMLNWRTRGLPDTVLGPHQLSDGSIRFMALAALLLQPPSRMPNVIVIDEPELGLHPAAILELAGMIRTASKHAQVIVATQSPQLLDEFSAEQIMVVERDEQYQSTVCRRLDGEKLESWLDEYTIGDLWEKNMLGGRP